MSLVRGRWGFDGVAGREGACLRGRTPGVWKVTIGV